MAGQAGAIAVSVSGANPGAAVGTSDEGGGRYTATYTPTVTGTDQVEVKVSGTAVPGLAVCERGAGGGRRCGHVDGGGAGLCRDLRPPGRHVDHGVRRVRQPGDAGRRQLRIRVNQGAAIAPTDNGDGTYTARLNLGDRRVPGRHHARRQGDRWEPLPDLRALPVLRVPRLTERPCARSGEPWKMAESWFESVLTGYTSPGIRPTTRPTYSTAFGIPKKRLSCCEIISGR